MIPWVISPQDERLARKKAEGLEDEERRKKDTEQKDKQVRLELRKKIQAKKSKAEQKMRKHAERHSHRAKRDKREDPSERRKKSMPSRNRNSSAQETIKPKFGGEGRDKLDKQKAELKPHVPYKFDALGF